MITGASKPSAEVLSDMQKNQAGSFPSGPLLGKRVDYSGRSVIVVGSVPAHAPCGLAAEADGPRLHSSRSSSAPCRPRYAQNMKAPSRGPQRLQSVWGVLEERSRSPSIRCSEPCAGLRCTVAWVFRHSRADSGGRPSTCRRLPAPHSTPTSLMAIRWQSTCRCPLEAQAEARLDDGFPDNDS